MVTESVAQLAIQMLPGRSATVPCGQEIGPAVSPVTSGETASPFGRNTDTLLAGGTWQPVPAKPKLPTQMRPFGAIVMPQPAPERPPPKYGEPGKFSPHG